VVTFFLAIFLLVLSMPWFNSEILAGLNFMDEQGKRRAGFVAMHAFMLSAFGSSFAVVHLASRILSRTKD
jgi:hypothetical protein